MSMLFDTDWYLQGPELIRNYNPDHVNAASYDCHMSSFIRIQRWRGREYPDTLASLENGTMTFIDPHHGGFLGRLIRKLRKQPDPVVTVPAIFRPGDAFLASTVERFIRIPSVVMMWIDKSSTGREGITHRHAGLLDPGFSGEMTLEYDVQLKGILRPYLPIGQVVAFQGVVTMPYDARKSSRYAGQTGPTSSRNKQLAFKRIS